MENNPNDPLYWVEYTRKLNETNDKRHPEEAEARRKVLAQPFITNQKLEYLQKSQTPKWIGYAMLILTIIILGLTFYLAFIK